MPYWYIRDTVDLERPAKTLEKLQAPPVQLMMPGDNGAHVWNVTVNIGSEQADLTGLTVQGFFQRADGVTVAVEGSASGNTAIVEFPRDVYLVRGALRGIVRLGDSVESVTDPVTTLIERTFYVRDGVGNIVDPATAFPTLAALAEDVAEVEDELDTVESGLSAVQTKLAGVTGDGSALNFSAVPTFSSGIAGVTNYTSSEEATGGTWTDGKAIYRRVIAGDFTKNSVSTSQTQTLASGFTGYDTIVSLSGIIKAPNGLIAALPFGSAYGVSECIGLYVISSDININFGDHWGTGKYTYSVVVEYTKSSS